MLKKDFIFLLLGGVLYFLVAQAGKFLFSFEPYNISLLWLPFGIGVILVEKYGIKATFFIFVASFASHFNITYDNTFNEIIYRIIPALADSIAPVFSVYLIKRYVGNDFKDISVLFPLAIFGGVIPTCISGTIISLNLLISGFISLNEVLEFTIFLVYSDILGLMLLYPLYKNYDNTSITKKEKSVFLNTFVLASIIILLSIKYLYLIFLLYPIILIATFKIRIKYLMVILLFVVVFSIFMFRVYESYTVMNIQSLDFILAQSSFLATFIFIIIGVSLHNAELEDKKQKIVKSKKQIKKNENALRQHTKLAAMGELIGLIAHQWRQPLATSNIIVSTLQAKNQEDQLSKEYLAQKLQGIEQTNLFMSETIENFLQYFSPNKEKEIFSALDATNKTLDVLKTLLDKNSIKLMINFQEDSNILGFKDEYSQVLLTLITNCIQAFEKQTKKYICIEGFSKDKYFYLSVYDNAGGINPKDLPKIFEPYFSTKERTKGSGLGLYIAKMIIENNMKGLITAQNFKDGAKFTIKTLVEHKNAR